jgi:uridine monophosphate synthetase
MSNDELNNFIDGLYDLKLVKFGEYVLGSGLVSPVYFDLRSIISSTKLLKQASKLFANYIQENKINYDVLCGVPFGASSLATAISLEVDKPSVFKRKVAKDYGGKKMVEGIYQTNDKVLLIEDVVVYATGLIEAAEVIEKYN